MKTFVPHWFYVVRIFYNLISKNMMLGKKNYYDNGELWRVVLKLNIINYNLTLKLQAAGA